MFKRVFIVCLFTLAVVSCTGGGNQPSNGIVEIEDRLNEPGVVERVVTEEERDSPIREEVIHSSNIPVESGQLLPPYGMVVTAETALLTLHINSILENAGDRMIDIQNAVETITSQTSESEKISVEYISVNQVDGAYIREESESSIQNIEAASVTLTLAIQLSDNNRALLESVVAFDEFINGLDFTDTITTEVLSLTTKLGDLEPYRQQITRLVYQELDSIRETYGESVQFRITGLIDELKIIQLNDTEFYVFLDLNIAITEF